MARFQPLWGTFPFKVAEPHKGRCRAIFDCSLNDIFTKTPKYSLKTKTEIRRALSGWGKDFIFLQFDFKAFYDQLVLAIGVRKFFGVLGHDDMYYNLMLLPMGFRLAVACAQAVMWGLLNFVMGAKVATATCIDNVCFAGSRHEVYAAASTFLKRVEECNFTLNGMEDISFTKMSVVEQHKFLKNLEETNPEFLGEKYGLEELSRKKQLQN